MEVIGTGSRKYCEDIDVLCVTGRPEQVEILHEDFFVLEIRPARDSVPKTRGAGRTLRK